MQNDPVSTMTRFGTAPFFIFGDHASNAIPQELNCLGLPEDILQTHIAWDIGTKDLIMEMARGLNGTAHCCNFSRLVVDVNRSPGANDLIPAVSDQIPIPGNQMMSEADRKGRLRDFHVPYHEQLAAELNAADEQHAAAPFVVSVHSFTRRLMGAKEDRPWPVGLLWSADEANAHRMINFLAGKTGWSIGDNEPYDARVFNYTIERHIIPRGWPHLTFEVRQDMLSTHSAIMEMAHLLTDGIQEIARSLGQKYDLSAEG